MKKIFLDVGGHQGQTLQEVLKPIYHFDVVHCFEPMKKNYESLKQKFTAHFDRQLILHNFGLAGFEGERNLYGSNENGGASLFSDKQDLIQPDLATLCRFRKMSSFLRNIFV